ncbi:MAG: hypothetical protein KKG75_02050 [Nanoarchaeota archaeon]|nr:hypothetical protein [Nanoarchaeota archaeon]
MWELYRWTIMVESVGERDRLQDRVKTALGDITSVDTINGHDVYSIEGTYVGVNPTKSWSFGAEGRALQVTLARRDGRRVLSDLNAVLGQYSEKDKIRDSIPIRNFL